MCLALLNYLNSPADNLYSSSYDDLYDHYEADPKDAHEDNHEDGSHFELKPITTQSLSPKKRTSKKKKSKNAISSF